jgi:hypothetical protein
LGHAELAVAQAAAVGEWHASSKSVRANLRQAWREVVLRCPEKIYPEMLIGDPELAFEWIAARLREGGRRLGDHDYPASRVLPTLTQDQRCALLRHAPAGSYLVADVLARLVGDDLALFRSLLADPLRAEYHLAPLHGRPQGAWADKALLAMEAGHSAEEVVRAAFRHGEAYVGSQSPYEEAWVSAFEALGSHPDERIRRVAEVGRATAQRRLESVRRNELAVAVYGER